MITVLAQLTLYSSNKGRKTPFLSGYRPLFTFPGYKSKTSGKIDIIGADNFPPGHTAKVKVTFLETVLKKGSLKAGMEFTFTEGIKILGEGRVLKILDK